LPGLSRRRLLRQLLSMNMNNGTSSGLDRLV
jgi:hypothetical protein